MKKSDVAPTAAPKSDAPIAAPKSDVPAKAGVSAKTDVPLVQVDKALESLRASNYNPSAAVGEPVDNALEAKANTIKIRLVEGERTIAGKKPKTVTVVDKIAIADDGIGMSEEVLHKCLVLGYSTRFGSRSGMGRFGVGATLAGISQAKRIEVYSRSVAGAPYLRSYIDLEEISEGTQTHMPVPEVAEIPAEFKDMMGPGTGTLVVWSKCDRLTQGEDGTVHDLKSVADDLLDWLSRAYRQFLDGGVKMHLQHVRPGSKELHDRVVEPHDPLYLMTVPRFAEDPKAELLYSDTLDWTVPSDHSRKSPVQIRVSLLPEEWRLKRGWGDPRHRPTKDRRIHENEGFSVLRANREIFFGVSPKFYPSAVQEIDRWIGIEIAFEPDLDECFRVRNVKRGAEPVDALRDALRNKLKSVIEAARKRVQATYTDQDNKDKAGQRIHQQAEEITAAVERVSPKARTGKDVDPVEKEAKLDEVAAAAAKATEEDGVVAPLDLPEQIKARLKQLPFSIVDMQWPGKEFIDIEHLDSNTIVKLNNRHPFFTRIYAPILKASGMMSSAATADGIRDEPSADELRRLAGIVQVGLDLLIVAYAKAETMYEDPEKRFEDLRTHWGMFLFNMLERFAEGVPAAPRADSTLAPSVDSVAVA